jgi:PDZ domain-containing protein
VLKGAFALLLAVAVLWVGTVLFLHFDPYYVISPGDATSVNGLIRVPSPYAHPTHGSFLLTDVLVGPVSAAQLPGYLLDAHDDLVPAVDVLGPGGTQRQLERQGAQEMSVSQDLATIVALDHLPSVPVVGHGALVISYVQGTPAARWVRPDDVIVAIDGSPISGPDQLRRAVGAMAPGAEVELEVDNAVTGDQRTVTTRLITSSAATGGAGHALLGVMVAGNPVAVHRLEGPVKINSDQIGGPSAGLAFTLGVIDKLSNGDLSGGRRIAATGEIDARGDVLPIGGLPQKMVAVREAHAKVFFVPYGQSAQDYRLARQFSGGKVAMVKVHDVTDALAYLARTGGDMAGVSVPAL